MSKLTDFLFSKPTVPLESAKVIGSIVSATPRGNGDYNSGWTQQSGISAGAWTTLYIYSSCGSNSTYTTQAFNNLMGDGQPNDELSNQFTWSGDRVGYEKRYLEFAYNNRLGYARDRNYYNQNDTNTPGDTYRIIPIRNTTNASITKTIYFRHSSHWSNGYEGAAVGVYTPNSNKYSTTTGGSWSQVYTYQSSSSNVASSASITIPANTTVLVMMNTTHNYRTTYRASDTSMFYNLSTTFSSGVICDLRILEALYKGRTPSAGYTNAAPYEFYQTAAEMYGDR